MGHSGDGAGETGRVDPSDYGSPCARERDSGIDGQEEQQAERWVWWLVWAAAQALKTRNTSAVAPGDLGEAGVHRPACPSYCPLLSHPGHSSVQTLSPADPSGFTFHPNHPVCPLCFCLEQLNPIEPTALAT